MAEKFMSEVHDGGEGNGLQAGATYQRAVDFRLRHEAADIVGLDAATVKNPARDGCVWSELLPDLIANTAMRVGGHFRRGYFAGADRPYRLVSDDDSSELLGRKFVQPA